MDSPTSGFPDFDLVTPTRTWHFRALNHKDRNDWVQVIAQNTVIGEENKLLHEAEELVINFEIQQFEKLYPTNFNLTNFTDLYSVQSV